MPKKQTIISQADLVRISGATKQAIHKAIKAGHIKAKTVKRRKMVVFDHELTQLWYEKELSKTGKQPVSEKTSKESDNQDIDISLADLVRIEKEEKIKDIKASRRLKELKFRREREDLIEKKATASVLFQYLEALNINMFNLPDMVIDTMIDKIKAGAERGDLIKIMRDMIEKEIKNTKNAITERLK